MVAIAVIGAGAVGCYYGGLLARAGHDVRFLMRRDLEAVRRAGLTIRSCNGDFSLPSVAAFATPEELGTVDWVICSLKSTQLEEAARLIRPCLGAKTRVLALMNGLDIEARLGAAIGRDRVFGGMAFVCINRGEPGVVNHLKYGRVTLGHLEDDLAQTEELAGLLRSGEVEAVVAPNLRSARWEKLAWNVPFNGLSVACGGVGTERITGEPALRPVAERAMRELIAIGNADLAALGSALRIDEETLVASLFALTDTMGDYRTSMVIDYVLGRPLEVEAILGGPARRAEALGVAAPTVQALYGLVLHADVTRRGLLATLRPEDL
ncbi:MAG: 2-dehydropantoate 2-reductase [Dehalococcoidia bacterium]